MKPITLAYAITCLLLLGSCKSREDMCESVAYDFLKQMNNNTTEVDSGLMTKNFAAFIKDKSFYSSEGWVLNTEVDSDSVILVESKGQTYNGLGRPMEITQALALTNVYGAWQVFDSYNLIEDELDFEVVDTRWDFLWDKDKDYVLSEAQKKVKLKILERGRAGYLPNTREGKLKIINNSDLDIKGIKVLIEHFDRSGKSVNTDYHRISDIIRKQGYREFIWYTNDCSNCYRQEFEILFVKESN